MGSRSEQETESTCPPLVSIVVPVYNESKRIHETLHEVAAWLRASACLAEIIVVDDGSTDDTANLVSRIVPTMHALRLIELPHGGKARAVLAGLRMARGDIVGFMDADLATPLSTLHTALDVLQKGADVVIGSREGPGASRVGEPWYRHAMGRVFNSLVRWTLLPGIQDSQCGFKFMTRDARDRILPRVRLYTSEQTVAQARVTAFDVELLFIARLRDMTVHIIPVAWEYGNQSKVNPVADTLQNLEDVARVWLNGKRGLYQRER
ncbi:glycosyltransferase family 2 protein [soil metagenome]